MLEELYGKTFLILGGQLTVTWLSTMGLIALFRNRFHARAVWVSGAVNEDGNLDLDLDWGMVKPWFFALLVANIAFFILLIFFGKTNLYLGIPLFTAWSILTGIELALCLISVDENLGGKVLALTALITIGAGLVGARSGIDFSFLEGTLFTSLLLLVGVGLLRVFFSIPRWVQRLSAFGGVVVFTGYLLFDFHRLAARATDADANTWETAMRLSISIYLDVINLFLHLLDLMSQ